MASWMEEPEAPADQYALPYLDGSSGIMFEADGGAGDKAPGFRARVRRAGGDL